MSVSLEQVGHRFDQGWLFREMSLSLSGGHVYALTGPSGSGKSTLLSFLAGWAEPLEGRVSRESYSVAWVFQNPHGVPHRTARDHVALPYLARGDRPSVAEPKADALLARFGLSEVAQRPFSNLSGGEAQRLMLARAIAGEPGLLLIDEPTAQLDVGTSRSVNDAIAATASEGTIVVVATHDEATRDACSDIINLSGWSWPRVQSR